MRDEVAPDKLVAGDIGPSGRMMPPLGDASADELRDVFAEQAEALVAGGVDLIAMTTFFDLAEARAAVLGARAMAGSLPVAHLAGLQAVTARLPHDDGRDPGAGGRDSARGRRRRGRRQLRDHRPRTCRAWSPSFVPRPTAPLVIQPNAGQPSLVDGHTTYGETPESFASFMPAIVAAGANIVGGLLRHDAGLHRGAGRGSARVGQRALQAGARRAVAVCLFCSAAPTPSKMRRTACSAVISMGS